MDEGLKRLVRYHGGRVPEDDMGEPPVWLFLALLVGLIVGILIWA